MPSDSPTSVISTMFSWLMRLTARASRRKRSRCSVMSDSSGRRILIALRRAMSSWRARYTTDIPPEPRRRMSR